MFTSICIDFFIPLDLDVHRTNYIFYDLKLDILLYMANLVTQKYLTDKKIMSLDYYIDRYEDYLYTRITYKKKIPSVIRRSAQFSILKSISSKLLHEF